MTEWNAAGYSRIAELQQAMAAEVLALLRLNGDERVLDLGCGNGNVTAEIAARVPRGSVVGVDASAEMVEYAAQHYDAQHPNLRFERHDIRALPFHEEFDRIVSFNALHWIPDQQNALRAIHSAMKPDAKAELRLVPRGERKSLENVVEETRRSPRWSSYYEGFHDPYLHLSPEEYRALAKANGLRPLSCNVQDKSWDFGARDAFEASCMVTLIEWTKRLPEGGRLEFVRDALDRYRREVTSGPGEESTFKFYQMDIALARDNR